MDFEWDLVFNAGPHLCPWHGCRVDRSSDIIGNMSGKKKNEAPRGMRLLYDPRRNKGTVFSETERDSYGLRGLLPPRVSSLEQQMVRIMENFRRKPNDLEKYVFMMALQDRNETLFYRVIVDHIEEMMPIIYTPTVGEACQKYGHIFRRPRGMFISIKDRGRVKKVLRNWPDSDIRVIVVTDGERILGLGDLGANGMGIPVGKLALYTACAGVQPKSTLPITLDVGTNNELLRDDPLYIGTPVPRTRGSEYDELIEEFVVAVQDVFPNTLIQFEDFANTNAFALLEKYRDRACTFNDDIQGTAAVALAGILSASRITGATLADHRLLFLGAGSASVGIAELIVSAMVYEGMSESAARERCWFVDSKGLVVKSRTDLARHKLPFAHEFEPMGDLLSAVTGLEPTAIIGASGQPAMFTPAVLAEMARINARPIVFALSNPTSKAECTAEEAYRYTKGTAVFASGSPFGPVTCKGHAYHPGQANNVYVFPGVGLGILTSGSNRVTDEMFYAAARALAGQVSQADLDRGTIFPPLTKIREVSAVIATAVADVAYDRGLTSASRPKDHLKTVRSGMYEPDYADL